MYIELLSMAQVGEFRNNDSSQSKDDSEDNSQNEDEYVFETVYDFIYWLLEGKNNWLPDAVKLDASHIPITEYGTVFEQCDLMKIGDHEIEVDLKVKTIPGDIEDDEFKVHGYFYVEFDVSLINDTVKYLCFQITYIIYHWDPYTPYMIIEDDFIELFENSNPVLIIALNKCIKNVSSLNTEQLLNKQYKMVTFKIDLDRQDDVCRVRKPYILSCTCLNYDYPMYQTAKNDYILQKFRPGEFIDALRAHRLLIDKDEVPLSHEHLTHFL